MRLADWCEWRCDSFGDNDGIYMDESGDPFTAGEVHVLEFPNLIKLMVVSRSKDEYAQRAYPDENLVPHIVRTSCYRR